MITTKNMFWEKEPASRSCSKCGEVVFYERFKQFPDLGPNLCDKCGNNYDTMKRESAMEEIFNSLLDKSEIPLEYRSWDESIAASSGSDKVLQWMRKRARQSVFVYGIHGRGKTHTVAYCAYKMLEMNRKPMKYINLGKWLSSMMALKIAHADINVEIHRLYTYDLVVFDDIGKEKLTESKIELIYNIIDMRERQRKATWFTSNLSIDNLATRFDDNFGPAIIERIRRMVGDNTCLVG